MFGEFIGQKSHWRYLGFPQKNSPVLILVVLLCRKLKPFSQYATTWSATQTSHPGPLKENQIFSDLETYRKSCVVFLFFFGGYINDDYINVYKSQVVNSTSHAF